VSRFLHRLLTENTRAGTVCLVFYTPTREATSEAGLAPATGGTGGILILLIQEFLKGAASDGCSAALQLVLRLETVKVTVATGLQHVKTLILRSLRRRVARLLLSQARLRRAPHTRRRSGRGPVYTLGSIGVQEMWIVFPKCYGDLSRACLENANLQHVDLWCVNLVAADLRYAATPRPQRPRDIQRALGRREPVRHAMNRMVQRGMLLRRLAPGVYELEG
jgi:hypothetical protein